MKVGDLFASVNILPDDRYEYDVYIELAADFEVYSGSYPVQYDVERTEWDHEKKRLILVL